MANRAVSSCSSKKYSYLPKTSTKYRDKLKDLLEYSPSESEPEHGFSEAEVSCGEDDTSVDQVVENTGTDVVSKFNVENY